jgi:signal transduction histidine kinase
VFDQIKCVTLHGVACMIALVRALAGRIAAGIAHEIRNPLTTVRGYLQFLKDEFNPDTAKLINSLLIPELDRANKIISDFLTIANTLLVKLCFKHYFKPFFTFSFYCISKQINKDLEHFRRVDGKEKEAFGTWLTFIY